MADNIESMNPKAELVNTIRFGSGFPEEVSNATDIAIVAEVGGAV
jgi:hypothetical protein